MNTELEPGDWEAERAEWIYVPYEQADNANSVLALLRWIAGFAVIAWLAWKVKGSVSGRV
ncbi:MAG TPA: hypothetical protein VFI82_04170 [Terriglobales bacterium]|jgi:hypothetical protein|nr:hypothetical protein [Terriglobales bacterium]